MKISRALSVWICCITLTGLCQSHTYAMAPESGWHHGAPFAYDKGLLDSIGFDRSVLADKGVNVHLSQMAVYQNIADGGFDNKDDDEFSTSYDLQVYFDSTRMGLWNNGYGIIRAEGKSDDFGVNPKTGAIIPVNFDAAVPEPKGKNFELTEWWYSQQFLDGKIEPLIGMYDIARFFDLKPLSAPYQYRFLQVSPDVQYLLEPGIQKDTDDTLVLGLRALIHL